MLGCHIADEPVYLPIEYRDTPLKTNEVTQVLLRQALRKYDLVEIFDKKMMPVCSDGALAGVGRELDMISSKCMSHNYNCVSKTWLNHQDYLTADMAINGLFDHFKDSIDKIL